MTSISIIGAGNVARGIATRAKFAGYPTQIVARDAAQGDALAADIGGDIAASPLGGPVTGDIIVLAVPFSAVNDILPQLGDLAGKTVVDATNPLNADFTGLATAPGTSGAQTIASSVPNAHVVKAFNTVFAGNVAAGEKNGQPLDLFVAGDDATAKNAVTEFAEKSGFRVIDTGALVQAGVMEAIAWLHMQLQFTRGTNFASAVTIVD